MDYKSQSPNLHKKFNFSPINLPKINPVRLLQSSQSNNLISSQESLIKSLEFDSQWLNKKVQQKNRIKLTLSRNLIKNNQLISKQEHPIERNVLTELPLSCSSAIVLLESVLPIHELIEMKNYETIYFIGKNFQKNKIFEKNTVIDDENCDLILNKGDHIAFQFEILEEIGKGSFSKVYKCFDHKSKKEFAIKVIKNQKRFKIQAKTEVKILKELQKNNPLQLLPHSCVELKKYFIFRNHIFLLFELLGLSLYKLLEFQNFSGFHSSIVKELSMQILKSLNFLRDHKIIHCDLKPENIAVVNSEFPKVKLIDFGSACFENNKIYSYIQSRIYRAPEVIFGLSYSTQIDIWSFGCILVELLTGQALFNGINEYDQLYSIIEVIGLPPENLENAFFRFVSNHDKRKSKENKNKIRIPFSRPLEIIVGNDEVLIELIKSNKYLECLNWNPENRITPEQALKHKWLVLKENSQKNH